MSALNEDKILDFLDGRLTSGDEEELLHTLAVSPERRQLLREHIKLRELTSNVAKQKQFAVPGYVTTQLFDKLEDMGFAAPMNAEQVLTRAPQMTQTVVTVRRTAPLLALLRSGLRFGASSLALISVMSFLLGAGAYYVFGERLGLHTRSEQFATAHASFRIADANVTHQYSTAAIERIGGMVAHNETNSITLPELALANVGVMPEATFKEDIAEATPQEIPPTIEPAGARKPDFALTVSQPRRAHGLVPIAQLAFPTPLAMEKGTVGISVAGGVAPGSGAKTWSQLSELKFGWTIGNYFTAHASMGQLSAQELGATAVETPSVTYPKPYVIKTVPGSRTVNLIGIEGGFTLDQLDIPLEGSVGLMVDGSNGSSDYSKFYKRASLRAHFEPWKAMKVSIGAEALLYSHDLTSSINSQRIYKAYNYSVDPNAQYSETCGFIGPSIEIGWHF